MPARTIFLSPVFSAAPAIKRDEPCGSPSHGEASCASAVGTKRAHASAAHVIINEWARASRIVPVLKAKRATHATDIIVTGHDHDRLCSRQLCLTVAAGPPPRQDCVNFCRGHSFANAERSANLWV